MFYEGTEKRLLICTQSLDLFSIQENFWQALVNESGADILSSISNSQIKAYLLSESSLFIWKNRLLLITCGNTQLVKAALFIQQQLTKKEISTLLFQRHHPLQPALQYSNFEQDSLLLTKQFKGQQQHWRADYQGDMFLFGDVSTSALPAHSIYMLHELSGKLAVTLQQQTVDKVTMLDLLQLEHFFDDLQVDHFSFDPKGYSLNAIRQGEYLTIHLTPEEKSTYLSVETSFTIKQCHSLITHLKVLFSPKQTKEIHFTPTDKTLNINVY